MAAKAGTDRGGTETTASHPPEAATDRAPAKTASHPTTPESAAHSAPVKTTTTATHSSTAALGSRNVRKECGRDQSRPLLEDQACS